MSTSTELEVRTATQADLPSVVQLLEASLGWVPDEQHEAFFGWKHHENPFGRSPAWVAVDDGRIVGLRVWLRWQFSDGRRVYRAIRAVDTATHPEYQGRGIFRRLTTFSLGAIHQEGIDFVFNTPNEQSRPGYLKMGWEQVGRLPTTARFRSPSAAIRAVRARVPAEKWSEPCEGGVAARTALADDRRIAAALASRRVADGRLRTVLSPEFLRWRYGFEPLHYRALTSDDGLAVFRIRHRGDSLEGVVCLVLAADRSGEIRLLRQVARESQADHLIRITPVADWRAGFLPLPGQGPILTWRAVNQTAMPPLERWDLAMGDVELF